jgi:phosphatidate phosphatase PAH1
MLKDSDQVKDALDYRTQCLQDYEDACVKTQKKVYQMSRLQQSTSISQEKVDKELEEMATIKKSEQDHKENLKLTSEILKRELELYKKNRNSMFAKLMDDYVSIHQLQLSIVTFK